MFLEKVALFFVVIFAIIGVSFLSIIIHEYTHYNDFRNFNVTDERLCGFVLPTGNHLSNWTDYIWSPAGYYGFSVETENMTASQLGDYKKAKQQTEVNAYTIGALIFVFYMICYMIITFARYKDKMRILKYKYALIDRDDYINDLEQTLKKYDNSVQS
jgi:hypothetical protein